MACRGRNPRAGMCVVVAGGPKQILFWPNCLLVCSHPSEHAGGGGSTAQGPAGLWGDWGGIELENLVESEGESFIYCNTTGDYTFLVEC